MPWMSSVGNPKTCPVLYSTASTMGRSGASAGAGPHGGTLQKEREGADSSVGDRSEPGKGVVAGCVMEKEGGQQIGPAPRGEARAGGREERRPPGGGGGREPLRVERTPLD